MIPRCHHAWSCSTGCISADFNLSWPQGAYPGQICLFEKGCSPMRRQIGHVLLLLVGLAALGTFVVSARSPAPAGQPAGGSVTVEWFGWSHYRFPSPAGKVVLTNPFTSNPDSPIKPEDIEKADL